MPKIAEIQNYEKINFLTGAKKMTQNRVQILGFKSFRRAKIFPFDENIN